MRREDDRCRFPAIVFAAVMYHKCIRLDRAEYARVGTICSITTVVRGRRPLFSSQHVAEASVTVLRERASTHRVPVYAYCIMPDHVHLVLGASPTCDVTSFVGQFKNLVQRAAWKAGARGKIWQLSFYDHFLRADEDLERVVDYVVNNPVRRGLAEHWREYPFSGSLVLGDFAREKPDEGFPGSV